MSDGEDVTEDPVVAAIGKASEALEYVERARGHLYSFHQLMGRADIEFGNAADLLSECGLVLDAATCWTTRSSDATSSTADGRSRWSTSSMTSITRSLATPCVASKPTTSTASAISTNGT